MCTGPSAVAVTKDVIATLIARPDTSSHMQTVLANIRGLSDDLLCDHDVLGKALPLSAEDNDPQIMHKLWAMGAAGLTEGLQAGLAWAHNPGAHYSVSKMMREQAAGRLLGAAVVAAAGHVERTCSARLRRERCA